MLRVGAGGGRRQHDAPGIPHHTLLVAGCCLLGRQCLPLSATWKNKTKSDGTATWVMHGTSMLEVICWEVGRAGMLAHPTISTAMIYLSESFPDTIITRSVIMHVCLLQPQLHEPTKHTQKKRMDLFSSPSHILELEFKKREHYSEVKIINGRPLAAGWQGQKTKGERAGRAVSENREMLMSGCREHTSNACTALNTSANR